tara:strand:+ start:118 stop:471 length:354 start_codon:yes stop_codon:yes gene_type:complete
LSQPAEDLRQYYITPTYLEVMRHRARAWSDEFIQAQLQQFRNTIPDYPEVHELLEGEMHRRKLNGLKRRIKKSRTADLQSLKATEKDPDVIEVIETELLIRQGVKRLPDSEENARIQ